MNIVYDLLQQKGSYGRTFNHQLGTVQSLHTRTLKGSLQEIHALTAERLPQVDPIPHI